MSKRALLLLTTMLATLVAASGVALAATKICQINVVCNGTGQNDVLIGTAQDDTIHGQGGTDLLLGLAGWDHLYGDEGRDQLLASKWADALYGGPGNDISNGGLGPDHYHFEANNWGQDAIYENRNTDPDNEIDIGPAVTVNLQIILHEDNTTNPEVSDAAGNFGNYTVNWSRDIIRDVFNQGSGDDLIIGNDRGNYLFSHGGTDQVYGGGGGDGIYVRDAGNIPDYVDCGPGDDTVEVDHHISGDVQLPEDFIKNCELILR